MQTVTVTIREVYGREMLYPANQAAQLFARLVGRKTFLIDDLRTISKLGYAIELAAHPSAAAFKAQILAQVNA